MTCLCLVSLCDMSYDFNFTDYTVDLRMQYWTHA